MASLQKNTTGQNIAFGLTVVSTGAPDATGTGLAGKVIIDNGAQASVAGTFTNKGNGQYNYAPTQAETNGVDVGFLFTATGDYPVSMDFHTDPPNFLSLSIDPNGNVSVTSNIKKNAAGLIMVVMRDSVTNAPKAGLGSFQPLRTTDGGVLANTVNTTTELSNGIYVLNLAAADTNGNRIMFVFPASGANTSFVEVWTQP